MFVEGAGNAMKPDEDYEMDHLLAGAMRGLPDPVVAIDRPAREIARARSIAATHRLKRLRRIQNFCALVAFGIVCVVFWLGSARVNRIQLAITQSTQSIQSIAISRDSIAAAATSSNSSWLVAILIPLILAAGAFAIVRSLEQPPDDLSPLLRF
jgi:hypothetical protein